MPTAFKCVYIKSCYTSRYEVFKYRSDETVANSDPIELLKFFKYLFEVATRVFSIFPMWTILCNLRKLLFKVTLKSSTLAYFFRLKLVPMLIVIPANQYRSRHRHVYSGEVPNVCLIR